MELVEGPSARAVVTRDGPLHVADALKIAEDVAQAIAAAAAVGVVHRDIKPANVLLSPDGHAKLADFGIAKDLETTLHSLTASGMGLGSMAYLPPEQIAEAKYVDARADVYSLGATLYHLLAGAPPFLPTNPQALVAAVQQAPPPLVAHRPDCPPAVAELVHHMLAKNADDRPPPWQVVERLTTLRKALFPDHDTDEFFRRVSARP
jgi:serine/threonine-protein kinase